MPHASRELHHFYRSRAWTNFRMTLIVERGPICQKCGRLVSNSRDIVGHHKRELTPENVHDTSISLNPDNVEIICRTCHDIEHQRFGYEGVGRAVYLVYGPPLSGKTTFVQQAKGHQDIVIDVNLLFASVTMLPEYDKPDALFPVVRQAQKQLMDIVKTRFGKWHNAWIVGGYADKYQREQVMAETGAEPIYCEATMEECLSRLRTEPKLVCRRAEYEGYINVWFERFSP